MSSRQKLNLPTARRQIAGDGVTSTRRRVFAAAAVLSLGAPIAQAQEVRTEPATTASNDALLKKMEQMEQRIRMLESQLKQKDAKEIAHARGQVVTPPADTRAVDAKPGRDGDGGPVKQAKAQNGAGADRKSVV